MTSKAKATPNPAGPATAPPAPMKAPEVARRLGISLAAVYRLAAAGTLPAHRVTERTWAFDPRDVEAYWDRCRRGEEQEEAPGVLAPKGVRPRQVKRVRVLIVR